MKQSWSKQNQSKKEVDLHPYKTAYLQSEALESVMCDVIKNRLKRRNATRGGKGNQPLIIKTSLERPLSSASYKVATLKIRQNKNI